MIGRRGFFASMFGVSGAAAAEATSKPSNFKAQQEEIVVPIRVDAAPAIEALEKIEACVNRIRGLGAEVKVVQTLSLKPGDTIVFQLKSWVPEANSDLIRKAGQHIFPDNQVLVLPVDLELSAVLSNERAAQEA